MNIQTIPIFQNQRSKWIFYLLALLFCSALRILLVPIYPLIIIGIFYAFKWKIRKNGAIVFLSVLLVWLLSIRNGWYVQYNLISFYYFLPFFLLILASPPRSDYPFDAVKQFMKALTVMAILNNIAGLIQYGYHPGDDNFVGLYGRFTVSQNGLSLINGLLFFYYFILFLGSKKISFLIWSAFFIACCVLGFYGAGIMALLLSASLYFLKGKIRNLLAVAVIIALTGLVSASIMKVVSPYTLDYNIAIVKRFLNSTPQNTPRKLTVFKNYAQNYPNNTLDFLFGSGPGTFNSRSAFMVGSPTYFNVEMIKSDRQPRYFKQFAYTLWNPTNTGPYDGFMNQPFTSILALLGEYGLIFTLFLFLLILQNYTFFSASRPFQENDKAFRLYKNLYRFCWLYILLLICIDNYIEYPEIIALLIIIVKLCEQGLRTGAALKTNFNDQ